MRPRTAVAAILLSLSLSEAAIAQVEEPTGNAGAGAGETAQPTAPTPENFDTFLENFSDPDFSSAIGGIDSAMTFHVVKLSELENVDAARLQEATTPHSAELTELREALAANDKAKAALEAEGVSADQVVWIAGAGEGDMTLYVADL